MKVWILEYDFERMGDGGIAGVYSSETSAREAGLAMAWRIDPASNECEVKWNFTHMVYFHRAERKWFEVRGLHLLVEEVKP